MRILWMVPYLPWPTTSGGKVRQYHLLRTLAERGHHITLVVQSKTPLTPEAEQQLSPLLERLIFLPRRSLKHPKTLAAALFSRLPLLTAVNGLSPKLSAQFNTLLNEHWDVIQIEHSYFFEPFMTALERRRKPFLLTEHNIESKLSGATYNKLPAYLKPLARYDRWRYQRWERLALGRARCVIAVTKHDAEDLAMMCGQPTRVVVNGVDTRAFANVTPNAASQRVLFIGNYDYAPNVDAVEWAVREIFPLVWKTLPQARFTICGFALPQRWRDTYIDSRLEWRGYVESLTSVQKESALFLAPLRDGGGSKLKVLEALAAGLPLVSTAQGVSGLPMKANIDYLAGETAEELADQIVYGLQYPDHSRSIGEAGRAIASATNDWSIAAAQLESVYREFT